MNYIKKFESFRSEYPDMFEPLEKEDIPEYVPGFEDGTIDPDDDEVYLDDNGKFLFSNMSDKEKYQDFLKLTRKRNIKETSDKIEINIKKLYHDFIMSIYNPNKHYKNFINNELLYKYVSDGVIDIMSDNNEQITGVIQKISYYFTDNMSLLSVKIKDSNIDIDNTLVRDVVTIDKIKSGASKYNL